MTDIQTEVPSSGGVMVCVTGQRSCERLINHGAKRKRMIKSFSSSTAYRRDTIS